MAFTAFAAVSGERVYILLMILILRPVASIARGAVARLVQNETAKWQVPRVTKTALIALFQDCRCGRPGAEAL